MIETTHTPYHHEQAQYITPKNPSTEYTFSVETEEMKKQWESYPTSCLSLYLTQTKDLWHRHILPTDRILKKIVNFMIFFVKIFFQSTLHILTIGYLLHKKKNKHNKNYDIINKADIGVSEQNLKKYLEWGAMQQDLRNDSLSQHYNMIAVQEKMRLHLKKLYKAVTKLSLKHPEQPTKILLKRIADNIIERCHLDPRTTNLLVDNITKSYNEKEWKHIVKKRKTEKQIVQILHSHANRSTEETLCLLEQQLKDWDATTLAPLKKLISKQSCWQIVLKKHIEECIFQLNNYNPEEAYMQRLFDQLCQFLHNTTLKEPMLYRFLESDIHKDDLEQDLQEACNAIDNPSLLINAQDEDPIITGAWKYYAILQMITEKENGQLQELITQLHDRSLQLTRQYNAARNTTHPFSAQQYGTLCAQLMGSDDDVQAPTVLHKVLSKMEENTISLADGTPAQQAKNALLKVSSLYMSTNEQFMYEFKKVINKKSMQHWKTRFLTREYKLGSVEIVDIENIHRNARDVLTDSHREHYYAFV